LFIVYVSVNVAAQAPDVGIPPLSTIGGGSFDQTDLANLNVHFSIPVFSRAGRGMPFNYALTYDSLIWVPVSSSGQSTWTPVANWGWRSPSEPALGYISYQSTLEHLCGALPRVLNNFRYHDPAGGVHPFNGAIVYGCDGDQDWTTAVAGDNSGYVLASTDGTENTMTITSRAGVLYHPPIQAPQGPGTVKDSNGNQITSTVNGSTTTIVDTLATTALTITGAAPSAVHYTYTAPSGAQPYVSVTYRSYTVTTQFGVSGIGEYSQVGQNLVDRVTLPDGSFYQFLYEATGTGQPYTGGGSGPVTARIAQVTLPTGGTITYTYGSSNSMMADGSPATLTRALSGGTWTYQRALQPNQSNLQQTWTAITDPAGNITDDYFSGIYLTMTKAYQGNRGTALDYSYLCYDGAAQTSGCPQATLNLGTYRSERTAYDYPNNGTLFSKHDVTYDQYGNPLVTTDYDYAASSNPILSQATVVYNSTLCSSYNICDRPYVVQVTDGTNVKSYSILGYDERSSPTHGSLTTVSRYISGTSGANLSQLYSYSANGTLTSATDPNGTQTTYTYTTGSCNNAFPATVTVLGLATNYQYNCTGGVVTQVADPNSANVTTSYTDPYFWRPASVTDQLSNVTNYSYYPTLSTVGQMESVMTYGSSTTDVLTTPDSLGRAYLQQTRESPTSGNWDTVQYSYDTSGRLLWLFRPFLSTTPGVGSGGGLPSTVYSYDNLGRYTDVTDWTGVHTGYTYNLNDATVTVTPAPSGENAKARQYEYDVLGRLSSVCEMSATLPGVGSCGQHTAQTGYKTSYGYDPLGNLLSVTQGAQSRSFTYDGLGRMLSESNPESGATNYTYDSVAAGYCAASVGAYTSSGDLVAKADANGNHVCYYYDGLHRLTDVGNNHYTATNPCRRFRYDNSTGVLHSIPSGITITNPWGRMVEAETDDCGSPLTQITDEWFSYSARGENLDLWESTPHSGGWYHAQQGYFANGVIHTLQGFKGAGTSTPFSDLFTYNLDGKGRPYGMTDSTASVSIWNSTAYNVADQPTAVVPSAGGTESFVYDGNSGRMTQWSSTAGSKTQTGTLTWNANGTLQTLQITDSANSANAQTCSNLYDDLARLKSAHCGTVWSQDFTYDAWGNINKSGSGNFSSQGGTGNHVPGFTYDSAGNVTNDGANTYSYNAEGRPITAAGVQMTFDALGARWRGTTAALIPRSCIRRAGRSTLT
jgi:YD repeat-containing protein